jgi:hypothetical protein
MEVALPITDYKFRQYRPVGSFTLRSEYITVDDAYKPNWRHFKPQDVHLQISYFISHIPCTAGHGSRAVEGMLLSSLARTLGSWVLILHKAWMFGMCMCLFCVCVVLCLGRGLATSWPLAQGVLPFVKWSWNWKIRGQGPRGCRASEKEILALLSIVTDHDR